MLNRNRNTNENTNEHDNIKSVLEREMRDENSKMLIHVSTVFLVALLVSLIFTMLDGDTGSYICYISVNAVMVLMLQLAFIFKLDIVAAYGDKAIFFIEGLIYLSGIIGGTVMCEHPTEIVTFAVILVFVPGIFYERIHSKVILSATALLLFVVLDYIFKPFSTFTSEVPNIVVLWVIGIVSSIKAMKIRVSNLRGKIIEADYNEHLREENGTIKSRYMYSVGDLLTDRDENTGEHVKRTGAIVEMLVDEIRHDNTIGVSEKTLENIIKAAPLHDVGKMTIDDRILRKAGRLSSEEYGEIKEHAERGARIIKRLFSETMDSDLATVAENIARYHHERFDGAGYPCGLSEEQIPIEARIMAIADVYDALISKRCYKSGMSFEEAFGIIESGMGSQFDPMLNKYFLACRPRLEKYYVLT